MNERKIMERLGGEELLTIDSGTCANVIFLDFGKGEEMIILPKECTIYSIPKKD